MLAEAAPSVLVVEDDRAINALIGAYVEFCGLRPRPVYDGQSAVDAAQQFRPDAVVLDLMLPDIDGFEVCRRLRADAATANTPIVILSAMGSDADKQRTRECGANDHLTKPFDPDRFIEVLKGYTA